jgi:16S rRNA (cytidine1402-2'-O)-methyltransferase
MTKHYEQTIRGDLATLLEWSQKNEVLGEITLVIGGAEVDAKSVTTDAMVARVQEYESAGMDRKGAIATVAEEFSLPKRSVYAAVVDANKIGK